MTQREFAKAVAAALEVAQGHPVKIEDEGYATIIYVLDADQALWRVRIGKPL